jgi:hypothetical protein
MAKSRPNRISTIPNAAVIIAVLRHPAIQRRKELIIISVPRRWRRLAVEALRFLVWVHFFSHFFAWQKTFVFMRFLLCNVAIIEYIIYSFQNTDYSLR